MWYWYLLGYVFTGAIAIVWQVVWFIIATPKRNGYDLDHWLDHGIDLIDEVMGSQTLIQDVVGTIITAFTWPFKLVWLAREVYPEIVDRYEELLIREGEESQ